ncbi:hypothetical protein ACFVWN_00435 [Nocardiopsis flavescens]
MVMVLVGFDHVRPLFFLAPPVPAVHVLFFPEGRTALCAAAARSRAA